MSTQKKVAPDSAASRDAALTSVEETLRMVARLPAPAGLEDRIHAGLQAYMHAAPREARVLAWPVGLRANQDRLRAVAAATLVGVVLGGGWGIYSRVQPTQTAKGIVLPHHAAAPGGFSNAGAMLQTLNGPVVPTTAPVVEQAGNTGEVKSPKAAVTPKQRKSRPQLAGKTALKTTTM